MKPEPLDVRYSVLAKAAAHFCFALAGALRVLGKALEEFSDVRNELKV
jgi:hypothetical protein